MAEKLKGAVGLEVKGGPKVANNAEDVALVRRMLRANRFMVAESGGGRDPDILKALSKAAAQAGIEPATDVIEPGGKLFKVLEPKYLAAQKAAAGGDGKARGGKAAAGGGAGEKKVDIVRVTVSGGTLEMTVPAFRKLEAKVVKSLAKYVRTLARNHWDNVRTVDEYRDALHVHNGLMQAFTHNSIKVVGGVMKSVKYPDKGLEQQASAAIKVLVAAHGSGNLAAIKTALPAAEQASNAYSKDIERFLKGFDGTARGVVTGLDLTKAAGFAAVTVMAAPMMVPAGLTAAQAVVATNIAVAEISTMADSLGKVSAGEKVTMLQLGKDMTVNGVVAGLTSAVGEAVPAKWFDAAGKAFGQKLASTGLGQAMGSRATDFAAKYVAGAGLEGVKSAMGSAITQFGKALKEGRNLGKDDLMDMFLDVAVGTLTGGFMKHVDAANTMSYTRVRHQLEVKILPERFAKAGMKNALDTRTMVKTLKEIDNKLEEEFMKGAMKYWMENATGKESPQKLAELGARAMETDARLQKLLDDQVRAILAKMGS